SWNRHRTGHSNGANSSRWIGLGAEPGPLRCTTIQIHDTGRASTTSLANRTFQHRYSRLPGARRSSDDAQSRRRRFVDRPQSPVDHWTFDADRISVATVSMGVGESQALHQHWTPT